VNPFLTTASAEQIFILARTNRLTANAADFCHRRAAWWFLLWWHHSSCSTITLSHLVFNGNSGGTALLKQVVVKYSGFSWLQLTVIPW